MNFFFKFIKIFYLDNEEAKYNFRADLVSLQIYKNISLEKR